MMAFLQYLSLAIFLPIAIAHRSLIRTPMHGFTPSHRALVEEDTIALLREILGAEGSLDLSLSLPLQLSLSLPMLSLSLIAIPYPFLTKTPTKSSQTKIPTKSPKTSVPTMSPIGSFITHTSKPTGRPNQVPSGLFGEMPSGNPTQSDSAAPSAFPIGPSSSQTFSPTTADDEFEIPSAKGKSSVDKSTGSRASSGATAGFVILAVSAVAAVAFFAYHRQSVTQAGDSSVVDSASSLGEDASSGGAGGAVAGPDASLQDSRSNGGPMVEIEL